MRKKYNLFLWLWIVVASLFFCNTVFGCDDFSCGEYVQTQVQIIDSNAEKAALNKVFDSYVGDGIRYIFFIINKDALVSIPSSKGVADFSNYDDNPKIFQIVGRLSEDQADALNGTEQKYGANSNFQLQVTGVAACEFAKSESIYIGKDCNWNNFFIWKPTNFGTKKNPLNIKSGETLSIDLKVEQNEGRWYTYFLILDNPVNSLVKEFAEIKQEKYHWHTDSGKDGWDYDGRATLEIKPESKSGAVLPTGSVYELQITAFQDFSEYTGIDYKYLKKNSIYFTVVDPKVEATPGLPSEGQAAEEIDNSIPGDAPVPDVLSQLSSKTVPALIGNIISGVVGVIGSIALIMFIYGGITWMTAMGNSEKTKKGTQIIFWSAMGIAIIFSSWVMIKFLLEGFK